MQVETKNIGINQIMGSHAEVDFGDRYKLRITSRKLDSGKCQVKFYATMHAKRDLYGYVLVESGKTLREVVIQINEKLETIRSARDFQQIHLYSIGKSHQDAMNFIIFDA